MREFYDFNKIRIKLASPDVVREWSYGEVKKPETINYRTLKPERDGLFCEKIFGTTKEWECYCGKFKSIRYKGVVCDKCGVEVTHYKVRRERMGHIELSYPVAHIWYYRTVPSRIALVLNMSANDVKSVLYFERYVIILAGDSGLDEKQLLTPDEYTRLAEQFGDSVYASIGADAIKELLSMVNLEDEIDEIRERLEEKRKTTDARLLKRLTILENFRDSGNKPEWMILDVVPVLPPELRPMVQLEGGRFATSDLNDLYRRVINRNNRLKRLLSLKAPDIIVSNEKRMLQESVDALFDNSRRKKSIKGKGNRPLKSLSDMLKGKQGRFRQNLLGKRVDYSGRTVIVVGPELKIYQCGLPKKMALELFKPFIMKWLVDKEFTQNIKSAKRMIENEEREVFQGLEEIIHEHPVLLNRAPTLHRLGIQAFLPVLIEGKAIQLHPLVCHAFNADFDGDQMAIHVPLSPRSQLEAWMLILSAHNLLNPANGQPIVGPTQDMILGLYYLTAELPDAQGQGHVFDSVDEIIYALETDVLEHRARIQFWQMGRGSAGGRVIETTAGRILFNELLPLDYPFVNTELSNRVVNEIIAELYQTKGSAITVKFLDSIKRLGFRYATRFAPTISIEDVKIPAKKTAFIQNANKEVEKVENEHRKGVITNDERYKKVIEIWNRANDDIEKELFALLKDDQKGFNPIHVMATSGARGSRNQIRQLAGMRGLMAKPSGDIIELPIRSNFKEGLGVLEFFISTHGARKGLADTALKTADAGYLTRRLVDVSQDVIIRMEDCGTTEGVLLTADKEGDKVVTSLRQKIMGRYLAMDIIDYSTDEVKFTSNTFVSDEVAEEIESLGYEEVRVRSALTCEAPIGICGHCYGMDLSTLKSVKMGEAVGTIAAQSIGQPGTQLTMRTFHVGGVATAQKAQSSVVSPYLALVKQIQGKLTQTKEGKSILLRRGSITISQILERYRHDELDDFSNKEDDRIISGEIIGKKKDEKGNFTPVYASHPGTIYLDDDFIYLMGANYTENLQVGSIVHVHKGEVVEKNTNLADYDPFNQVIVSSGSGRISYFEIEEGKNLKIEESDDEESSGIRKIVPFRAKKMTPKLQVYDKGKLIDEAPLPVGAILVADDNATVEAGDILAKIEKRAEKNRDITGGLPRVDELFEARRPKDACILAEIDGTITDRGDVVRDKHVIHILPDVADPIEAEDSKASISLPQGTQLLVQSGERVVKGDQINEGALDPHEILRVRGEVELQRYLIREIQEVYRMQGVYIHDKHIEVIIRQMLRKVEVSDAGDTSFVLSSVVDKNEFKQENERVIAEGGAPATFTPVLMGLTKAALNSESFLSAASFQETTRVLTDAAILGKEDPLVGLKENIIIGHLIPAGTGLREYRRIRAYKHTMGDLFLTEEDEEELYQGKMDTDEDENRSLVAGLRSGFAEEEEE